EVVGGGWLELRGVLFGAYTLTGASGACSLSEGVVTLTVTTDGGTCTVTNTRDTGQITFQKTVSGGDAEPGDFTFHVGDGSFSDGIGRASGRETEEVAGGT